MLPMRPMKLGGEFLIFGENSIEYLSQLEGPRKKAFVVIGGNFLQKSGQFDEIENILKNADFKLTIFDEVEPDPSINTVQKGAKKMMDFEPDWIIAIGGGSVMDAAKGMWIMYEHPELKSIKDITNPIPKLRRKAKMVNIPTSSGTGSEVSRSIVITDPENHVKHGIGDMELMPDIAILEPKLTVSLPKDMTSSTGMDAMTHAIEARVSNRANTLTDTLANHAIKNIFKNLPIAYRDPGDIKARENLLISSMIAGMAFTNVSLGITHSIAHAIGGKFGVAHGMANAIILPYVIQFNSRDERAALIYKEIEDMLGVESLIEAILNLNRTMTIPKSLQPLINDDHKFEKLLSEISQLALEDGCTKTNPIIPTKKQFESLFKVAYYGGELV